MVLPRPHDPVVIDYEAGSAAAEEAIKQLCIRILPGWSDCSTKHMKISKIAGGISNLLVKLDPGASAPPGVRPVAVKVFGAKTDLIIDRTQELQLLLQLNDAGFGAQVLATFANGRIEHFLTAKTLRPDEMATPSYSRHIAAVLRRFHGAPIEGPKEPTLFDSMRGWLQLAETLHFEDAAKAEAFRKVDLLALSAELDELQALCMAIASPVVFAHNDLLSGNILVVHPDATADATASATAGAAAALAPPMAVTGACTVPADDSSAGNFLDDIVVTPAATSFAAHAAANHTPSATAPAYLQHSHHSQTHLSPATGAGNDALSQHSHNSEADVHSAAGSVADVLSLHLTASSAAAAAAVPAGPQEHPTAAATPVVGGESGAAPEDAACASTAHNDDSDLPLQFIDFEYSAYTHRGYDFGNHFNEWAGFDCDYGKYPDEAAQRAFFAAYLAEGRALEWESVSTAHVPQHQSSQQGVHGHAGSSDGINHGSGGGGGSDHTSSSSVQDPDPSGTQAAAYLGLRRCAGGWIAPFSWSGDGPVSAATSGKPGQESAASSSGAVGKGAAASSTPSAQDAATSSGAVGKGATRQDAAAGSPPRCSVGKVQDEEQEIVRLMAEAGLYALVSHAYWGIWSFIQACYSPIDFDYLDYSRLRWAEYHRRKQEFVATAKRVFLL